MRKARKIQGLGYFSCQPFIQSRSTLFPSLDFDVMFTALVDFAEELGTNRILDLVHKRIHQFACKFSYAGSTTYF